MDKYEYRLRSEEILSLIEQENYEEAANIADTIDWRRVKSINMLLRVASLYRENHRNEDSLAILQLAYDRYPTNRAALYCLCEVSIELDDVVAAIEYYKEFVKQAPRDNGVFTLRYRILEAQEASLEERIELLEELKKRDYQEEWAYELAYLYHRVGLATKCVEECDDLILWFGDGPFVKKAMELKMLHAQLTPIQEKKYALMQDSRDGYSASEEDVNDEPDQVEEMEEVSEVSAEELMQDDTPIDEAVPVPKPRPIQDLTQYNTINLQKVVAESMRELFPDDEDIYAANKSEVEDLEYASKKLAESKSQLEIQEANEDVEDIESVAEETENLSEIKETEEVSEAEELNEKIAEEEIPVEDLMVEEVIPKEETIIFNTETIETPKINTVAQMTADIYEVKPDGNTGAIRTVYVPEQKLEPVMPPKEDFLIKDPAIVGDEAYNDINDMNEEPVVEEQIPFKPMTGQINIEDVLKEWERLKEENEQKQRENVRELVLRQTGQILANFDQAIKEMEDEEISEEEALSEVKNDELYEINSELEELEASEIEEEYPEVEELVEVEDTVESETEEANEDYSETEFAEENDDISEVEELTEISDEVEASDMEEILEVADEAQVEEVDTEEMQSEVSEENEASFVTMNTTEINDLTDKIAEVTEKETAKAAVPELRKFTEEEKQLFENFAVTKKSKKQIITAIDNMTLSSYTGNVVITGEDGMGTVTTAKNLLKCFKNIEPEFNGKSAKITGDDINRKNISEIFEKLRNGSLIIEQANGMSEKTVFDLTRLLNQENLGLIVFLIDTKMNMQKLFSKQAIISDYFNLRVDLVEMDNNALVNYAKNYALALEYSIDELGTLALHTRIENIQGGNHIVTKDEVKEIIDEAIWKSKKAKFKNFVDILLAKRYDEQDMIVLRERDFM